MSKDIWNMILKKLDNENDEVGAELAYDVVTSAIKYTKFRMDWFLYSNEEKRDNDKYRTSSHNAFIDSLNIYLRYLSKENNKTTLLSINADRKDIGDIANYIAYQIALMNR